MGARSGIKRGFERLSDRLGGGSQRLSKIGFYQKDTAGATGDIVVPAGTIEARIFGIGGGGGGSTNFSSSGGGAGGGSFEYVLFDPAGVTLSGVVGAGGTSGASTAFPLTDGGDTTVSLPGGLGTLSAFGGRAGTQSSTPALGRSGTGPAEGIYRTGGNSGQGGEGPMGGVSPRQFGSVQVSSGGGGAGPHGGFGGQRTDTSLLNASRGGGGSGQKAGGVGCIYIEYWGVAP